MEFIEVCGAHERVHSSCDCECTCGAGWPHDFCLPNCRTRDPLCAKKSGNRAYLIRRALTATS